MRSVLKLFLMIATSVVMGGSIYAEDNKTRYAGGDISLLPEYEKAGAVYKDSTGTTISDILPWLKQQGMNAMRVRLFVNPQLYKDKHQEDTGDTHYDPNACQDLNYIIPLCKRIVESDFALMLDFHYSDTWADPSKQWTPIEWENLSDDALSDTLYDYTGRVLRTLKANGVVPAFIQPGNEISYGMLWGPLGTSDPKKTLMGSDANWPRLGKLLNSAIKACREVCPQAQIVLHTERVAQADVLVNFYNKMQEFNVGYDIIGLSYYPYFHGDMSVLRNAVSELQSRFQSKDLMLVETGYSYKWAVPGTTHDLTSRWPYTEEGQAQYAAELVSTLDGYSNVTGLFWWWMEYNAYGTSLSGWYNAPLFDSTTGRVTPALKVIASFTNGNGGVGIIEYDNDESPVWYDLNGRIFPGKPTQSGLYINSGQVIFLNP